MNPKNFAGSLDITSVLPVEFIIREITLEEYETAKSLWNKGCPDEVIVVQELAFGCFGEPAARVSLWFDLHAVTELSPQEVKRLKRSRQRSGPRSDNTNTEAPKKVMLYPGSGKVVPPTSTHRDRAGSSSRMKTPSSFDTHAHKPFFCIEPTSNDPVSCKLVRGMLHHRITVLAQREHRAYSGTEAEVRDFITSQDFELRKAFEIIKADVTNWKWPVAEGRGRVSAETSVPKCSSKYVPSPASEVTSIWDGFLGAALAAKKSTAEVDKESSQSSLSIFRELAKSRSANKTSSALPHIKRNSENESGDEAWKSILVDTGVRTGWQMIKDHYLDANGVNNDNCMPLSPANGERTTSIAAA